MNTTLQIGLNGGRDAFLPYNPHEIRTNVEDFEDLAAEWDELGIADDSVEPQLVEGSSVKEVSV